MPEDLESFVVGRRARTERDVENCATSIAGRTGANRVEHEVQEPELRGGDVGPGRARGRGPAGITAPSSHLLATRERSRARPGLTRADRAAAPCEA